MSGNRGSGGGGTAYAKGGSGSIRYHLFFDYGDGERYHRELMTLRRTMRPQEAEEKSTGAPSAPTDPLTKP